MHARFDEIRNGDLFVALRAVDVEHERDERARQTRAVPAQHDESAPAQTCFPRRGRGSRASRRSPSAAAARARAREAPPLPPHDVVLGAGAERNGIMRKIRDEKREIVELLCDSLDLGVDFLDAVRIPLHPLEDRGCVLVLLLEPGYLLGDLVALALEILRFLDEGALALVEREETVQIENGSLSSASPPEPGRDPSVSVSGRASPQPFPRSFLNDAMISSPPAASSSSASFSMALDRSARAPLTAPEIFSDPSGAAIAASISNPFPSTLPSTPTGTLAVLRHPLEEHPLELDFRGRRRVIQTLEHREHILPVAARQQRHGPLTGDRRANRSREDLHDVFLLVESLDARGGKHEGLERPLVSSRRRANRNHPPHPRA